MNSGVYNRTNWSVGIYFVIDGCLKALVEQDPQDAQRQENSSINCRKCSNSSDYLKMNRHDATCQVPSSFCEHKPTSPDDDTDKGYRRKRTVMNINWCQTADCSPALTYYPSLFELRAKTDCMMGYLSKECLWYMSLRFPLVLVNSDANWYLIDMDASFGWTGHLR